MSENWRLRPWHQTPADHPQQPTRCEHVNRREQPARTKRPGQKHHKTDIALSLTQFKQFLPFNTWPAGLQRHRSGSNKITVFIELMKHPPSTCVLGITCSWWEISDKSTRLNWTVIRDYSHLRRSRLCPTWHDKASNCPIPYHTIIPSKILSLQSAGTSPLYIIQSMFQSD